MLYHWLLWQVQASNMWPGEELWDIIESLREGAPTGWWIYIKPYNYY